MSSGPPPPFKQKQQQQQRQQQQQQQRKLAPGVPVAASTSEPASPTSEPACASAFTAAAPRSGTDTVNLSPLASPQISHEQLVCMASNSKNWPGPSPLPHGSYRHRCRFECVHTGQYGVVYVRPKNWNPGGQAGSELVLRSFCPRGLRRRRRADDTSLAVVLRAVWWCSFVRKGIAGKLPSGQ
ncbi:hypothetical protein V5799_021971 [Amblyomma americanum]|uniref:Uncharacterized protein n=1 Tax=Amblyomma americanum TaxID=6943 RepID=A0AAQ4FNC7_AMBAM